MSASNRLTANVAGAFAVNQRSWEELFELAAELVSDVMGDACVIGVLADDGSGFHPLGVHHRDPERLARLNEAQAFSLTWPVSESVRQVMASGEWHVHESVDVPADARTAPWRTALQGAGPHTVMLVAIRFKGVSIGIIVVGRKLPARAYTHDDAQVLKGVADVLGLALNIAALESDARGPTRIVDVVQNVTDEHITKQEIAALLGVSNVLAKWDGLAAGAVRLLAELGRTLDFPCGTLWLPEDDVLIPAALWSEPGPGFAALRATTATLRCPLGIALAGRAWRAGRTETLADIGQDELLRRRRVAIDAGLRSSIAFPALRLGKVIAVLEFYHCHEPEVIDRLLPTIAAIGGELGEFFSRRAGELGGRYLTGRQFQVLMLAAAGNTTPQIAAALGISASTVRTHFDHIYEKLGVTDRAAAVAQGLRLGLIQ